jgi:isoleucyl-tRNA synthetase
LSNWYVRLCRRRFWKGEYEQDKICAYQTLYECLETTVRLIAPISPFFSDSVFQNLNAITRRFKAESVHHADFPVANELIIDLPLEERMQLAQDVSSLILSLRKKVNIKVRQPLQKVLIPVMNNSMKQQMQRVEDLIKAEVNVKEIQYLDADKRLYTKKDKAKFCCPWKKAWTEDEGGVVGAGPIHTSRHYQLEKEGQYNLSIDGEPVTLQITDVEISSEDIPGWTVAGKGSLTVALDVTITPELQAEGNAGSL